MITPQGKKIIGFYKEEGWPEWGVRAGVVTEGFQGKRGWSCG